MTIQSHYFVFSTLSTFQTKITKHAKKQKNVTHAQEKQKISIRTNPNWTHMLAQLNFKLVNIKCSKNSKKMALMSS